MVEGSDLRLPSDTNAVTGLQLNVHTNADANTPENCSVSDINIITIKLAHKHVLIVRHITSPVFSDSVINKITLKTTCIGMHTVEVVSANANKHNITMLACANANDVDDWLTILTLIHKLLFTAPCLSGAWCSATPKLRMIHHCNM